MAEIGIGIKFLPKDDELVLGYLLKKVKGEPLPSAGVVDCEIYGDKEPWKIFGKTSKKSYVFTKLKKKGKGRRIERKVGCGTWKGQNINPVKDSQNNHVGFKKLFVFEVKGSDNADNGHWLMHEYSLLNDQSDYVLCAIRNKHGIDVVDDDEPQQKRIRFNEDEQNSFIEAATPASTLASYHEALGFSAASNCEERRFFTSTSASAPALEYIDAEASAPAPALDFDSGASAMAFDLGEEPAPPPTLPSDEALMDFAAASNCEDGSLFKNERFAITVAELEEWLSDGFDRDLSEAGDARQVLFSNASVQATNAQEFNGSFQQQSMVNGAAESVSIRVTAPALAYLDAGVSTPALDFDSRASAMAFHVGAEPLASQTLPSDEALGFVAASNSFTEATPVDPLASDHEALTAFAAASNCEERRFFTSTSASAPALEYIDAEASAPAPALDFDSGVSAMAFDLGEEPAPPPTLPSDEALMDFAAASNCEDGSLFKNERFAITVAELEEFLSDGFDRDLSEAGDARQVLFSNASVQATNAQEFNGSFQQQSMVNRAAESVSIPVTAPALAYLDAGVSTPALDFDSRASAMAFHVGEEPLAAQTLPSDEALGFVAASNSFTEATPVDPLASDQEALTAFAAASNCEDHGLFSIEQFAAELRSDEFDRNLFEAEDARQLLISNESVQATIALELNRSFLQQNMERFSNNNAIEDIQSNYSLTTAAESVSTSARALDFDSGASAMATSCPALEIDAGFSFPGLGDMSFIDLFTFDDTM